MSDGSRKLAGKRALVTGAGSGIGQAIAATMAREGAHVAVHARSRERAQPVVDEIREARGRAFAVSADLADYPAVEAMCAESLERLGGIDVVVNNAGIFDDSDILDVDLDYWELNFRVNVTAPMLITRHTVPAMIEQGEGGCLIYMGSTASTQGDPDWMAYTASKHALVGLMKAAAAGYGRHRIRSNAIAPAWVETPMAERYFAGMAEETGQDYEALFDEGMGVGVLNARIEAQSIADLALYLASDSAQHITGQTLSVCGGLVMR